MRKIPLTQIYRQVMQTIFWHLSRFSEGSDFRERFEIRGSFRQIGVIPSNQKAIFAIPNS